MEGKIIFSPRWTSLHIMKRWRSVHIWLHISKSQDLEVINGT
uniref:Uncharacterized protein n=1 Tax=Arundo donax TaxID=35708 RepID=A0A0A9A7V9_ARUDO